MFAYPYFQGDDDEVLLNIQNDMYDYSINVIFEEIKKYEKFNREYVQDVYNFIASVFRFKVKEENFNNEFFNDIHIDICLLDKIPENYRNLACKWHGFLARYIEDNASLLEEFTLVTISCREDRAMGKAHAAAEHAIKNIREQHDEIPWLIRTFSYKMENNKYKIVYLLYDFSARCMSGYGGTEYNEGHIIFYENYLSIEDHESSRDAWDDAWHGRHSSYRIMSDQYHKLIDVLKDKYSFADMEKENATIKNIYSSLKTNDEKELFSLLISVINERSEIPFGGWLTIKICGEKITYTAGKSQYDDFYPECDTCNYDKLETIN